MKHGPTSCSLSGNSACVVTAQEQKQEQERYRHTPRGSLEFHRREEAVVEEEEQEEKKEREEEQGDICMLQRPDNPRTSRSLLLRNLNLRAETCT
jgi:hypothetical protein